jgi:phosphonate transport system ATP-binding protein
MIEVKNLSKVFPDGTKALDDVTLDIPDGQFVCVIGLSGAGKSTFMRCLNRLNDPTAGKILLEGQDIAFAGGRELRK